MNVFSLLDRTARRWPDAGAVFFGPERTLDWRGLRQRSLALAGALLARGGSGARIAIASENTPQYVELMFGTWAAGAAAVPMNYKLHPREMAQIA
ncbi:MAG: class I adenylate-forming enzyme family protein, partial [Variovorax sp.]